MRELVSVGYDRGFLLVVFVYVVASVFAVYDLLSLIESSVARYPVAEGYAK